MKAKWIAGVSLTFLLSACSAKQEQDLSMSSEDFTQTQEYSVGTPETGPEENGHISETQAVTQTEATAASKSEPQETIGEKTEVVYYPELNNMQILCSALNSRIDSRSYARESMITVNGKESLHVAKSGENKNIALPEDAQEVLYAFFLNDDLCILENAADLRYVNRNSIIMRRYDYEKAIWRKVWQVEGYHIHRPYVSVHIIDDTDAYIWIEEQHDYKLEVEDGTFGVCAIGIAKIDLLTGQIEVIKPITRDFYQNANDLIMDGNYLYYSMCSVSEQYETELLALLNQEIKEGQFGSKSTDYLKKRAIEYVRIMDLNTKETIFEKTYHLQGETGEEKYLGYAAGHLVVLADSKIWDVNPLIGEKKSVLELDKEQVAMAICFDRGMVIRLTEEKTWEAIDYFYEWDTEELSEISAKTWYTNRFGDYVINSQDMNTIPLDELLK